jgi:hypothetical protein
MNRYWLQGSRLHCQPARGTHHIVLSFCLDDPEQGAVVELPIVSVS